MEEHGVNYPQSKLEMIEGEEEYEVERIENSQHVGRWKKLQYLLSWKGYSKAHNSWEPAEQVHAPRLVEEYYRRKPTAVRRVLDKKERRQHWKSILDASSIPALAASSQTSPISIRTCSMNGVPQDWTRIIDEACGVLRYPDDVQAIPAEAPTPFAYHVWPSAPTGYDPGADRLLCESLRRDLEYGARSDASSWDGDSETSQYGSSSPPSLSSISSKSTGPTTNAPTFADLLAGPGPAASIFAGAVVRAASIPAVQGPALPEDPIHAPSLADRIGPISPLAALWNPGRTIYDERPIDESWAPLFEPGWAFPPPPANAPEPAQLPADAGAGQRTLAPSSQPPDEPPRVHHEHRDCTRPAELSLKASSRTGRGCATRDLLRDAATAAGVKLRTRGGRIWGARST